MWYQVIAVAALTAPALLVPQQLDQIVNEGTPGVEAHANGHSYAKGNAPVNGRVPIGSITKSFVAVATLQLVAENKVTLDEPVSQYVPHIKDDRITVRQVLQHTSGLPDYVLKVGVPKIADIRDRYFAPHDLLDAALQQPPSFPPGGKVGGDHAHRAARHVRQRIRPGRSGRCST